LNIDENFVLIEGIGSAESVKIIISQSSGVGINITGDRVTLCRLHIYANYVNSTASLIRTSFTRYSTIEDCVIYNAKGTALELNSDTYMLSVRNILFESPTAHYGKHIVLKDDLAGSSFHPLDIWFSDIKSFNASVAFELVSCEGIYLDKIESYMTDTGMYLNPSGEYKVSNLIMRHVNFDTIVNGGFGILDSGSYYVYNILIDQLWLYGVAGMGGYLLTLNKVHTVSIMNSFIAGNALYNSVVIGADSHDISIQGSQIQTVTTGTSAIYCIRNSYNLNISHNRIICPANAYPIVAEAGCDKYIFVGNLCTTAIVAATSDTKIVANNVVTG
jgi:hypothetical protein